MTRRPTRGAPPAEPLRNGAPARSETVGLYKVTRTSRPATIEELLKPDDPLFRVQDWLENIGRSIAALLKEPKKYSEAVIANARECSVRLTMLHSLMREIEQGHSCTLQTVAAAIERSAALAEEWQRLLVNASLEQPVKAHEAITRTGKSNLRIGNAEREREADEAALVAFRQWRDHPSRHAETKRYSPEEQLKKYRRTARPRPSKRASERLGRLLRSGTLK